MADGSVPITAGSGTNIRAVTNSGVQSGAYQQVFSLAGSDGTLSPFDPDGTLQVSPEPTGLFLDDFSGSLATQHTTGGTTAPTVTNGTLSFSTTTTAGTTSYERSIGTFLLRSGSYLLWAGLVQFEAAAVTNIARWFGLGLYGTPSSSSPITNGAIFVTDNSTGALFAAVFSGGTRTQAVSITRPSDGNFHRYEIRYRQSVVYYLIDGVMVASILQPNLAVAQSLAAVSGSAVNSGSAAGATPSLKISSIGVSDLSATNRTISDGVEPWKQATVKAASTAIAATDLPLAVGLHPTSPLPAGSSTIGAVGLNAGTNVVGAVSIGAATPLATYSVSTTTNTAVVVKSSAGNLQTLLIANPGTGTQWVKLFNATSVTLGTTAAIMDIVVAAGATISLALGPNGQRFTTGIAFAVTGAVGLANNTAGAGGVAVVTTYV